MHMPFFQMHMASIYTTTTDVLVTGFALYGIAQRNKNRNINIFTTTNMCRQAHQFCYPYMSIFPQECGKWNIEAVLEIHKNAVHKNVDQYIS